MNNRTAPQWQVLAAFAAVYIIWGSTFLAIGLAVQTIPPHVMAGVRFLLTGIVIFGFARWRGAPMPSMAHWRSALLIGLLLLGLGNASLAWAEETIPTGLAALIIALVPLWMVLIDWFRPGGVRPRIGVFAGVGLGLFGILLLIGPSALGIGRPLDLVGLVILIFAGLSWALGSVYSRHANIPKSTLMLTGMEMLVGGVVSLALVLALGEFQQFEPAAISTVSYTAVLYLIVIAGFLGFPAYVFLLQVSSPAKVSTYAYVNPVVAVFLGWAIVGETVTPLTIVATVIIVASVAIITLSQNRTRLPAKTGLTSVPEHAPYVPLDTAETSRQ